MSWKLLVVESPTKAKTIQKYLGKKYHVMASKGHVRDLRPKSGAVQVEGGRVTLHYEAAEKSLENLQAIAQKAQKTGHLILATDPDREGEAIAFHVLEYLKEVLDVSKLTIDRVCFHEITQAKVQEALDNPRQLDMNLINAQQARRALDYLVGFSLSPVLWKKIRPSLSAGRVQSPALRLIKERHDEIESFVPKEYWSLHPLLLAGSEKIESSLTHLSSEKLKQFSLTTKKEAEHARKLIESESQSNCTVSAIKTKKRLRRPAAPFITSTLQQEAARKLNFSAQNTMRVAQQLFEGLGAPGLEDGLITYMRTDSVSLSKDSVAQAREVILEKYGSEFCPSKPHVYKNKSKNAQEAHEAIRPTNFALIPEEIKAHLSEEQFRLYKLIWYRAIASQMSAATFEDQVITFEAHNGHLFEARRSHPVFLGFLSVYQEGEDEGSKLAVKVKNEKFLDLAQGSILKIDSIKTDQHFTEPPARFSEASLVKELEALGIGRPSTYASIISTLKSRGYVELQQKRFYPTDVGNIVAVFLEKFFNKYVDYRFTADLEDVLDQISNGERAWEAVIEDFWTPFEKLVEHITKNVSKKEVTEEKIEEKCPKCSSDLVKKFGKLGSFIACTSYPDCKYTRSLDGESTDDMPALERDCPSCSKPLTYKRGRYGIFIGCTGYPDCKHIESTQQKEAQVTTDVTCPECSKGKMVKKRSRRGTYFYSCSEYPDCKTAISGEPVPKACPSCNYPIMMIKETKRLGKHLSCTQKDCKHKEDFPDQDEKKEES